MFENNCQNFVKYLLKAVCPSEPIPDTIQVVWQRLQQCIWFAVAPNETTLPGAYPNSIVSTTRTFKTASETTWITASETTWVTASEPRSSTGSEYQTRLLPHLDDQARPPRNSLATAARGRLQGKTTILESIRDQAGSGCSALHLAIFQNNFTILKMLLDAKVDTEIRDTDGRTPLIRAAQHSYNDCVELLLNAGSEPMARDAYGNTALHYAIRQKNERSFNLLLEAIANRSQSADELGTGWLGVFGMHDVLGEVVRYKLEGWVGLMLNAGWNPSIKESSGQTALHYALGPEFPPLSPQIIRILVEAASDLAIQDSSGCTPLHLAVRKADLHTTKLLLDAGSDPWIENKQGFTAIDIAVGVGNREVLEEILRKATVKTRTVAKLPPYPQIDSFGRRGAISL